MSSNFNLTPADAVSSEPKAPLHLLADPLPATLQEDGEGQSDYAHLLKLMDISTRAATSDQALTEIFLYLEAHLRCVGMVLETPGGLAAKRRSRGSVDGITPLPLPQYAARQTTHLEFPFYPDGAGIATFQFASNTRPKDSLLRAVAQMLGGCVEREQHRAKTERAEASASRRIREVAALYDIGHVPVGEDIAPLLQLIVDRTALLMDAQACSMMLFDAKRQFLELAASRGLPSDAGATPQLLGQGIAGRVAQTEQPLLISFATRNDPRLHDFVLRPEIGSAMLVPMKGREGQILGVLSIRRSPGHSEFTEEELRLFSVFASQAALALSNARLLEDLKQRAEELSRLYSLSRALLSTTDLEALLQTVIADICSVVGFDRCCLFLRDAHRPLFTARLLHGYMASLARNPVKEGEGAVGLVARSKEMLLFDSQEPVTEEIARAAPYRQLNGFARSLGAKAFVALPILSSKETCIAVLVADNQRKRSPITEEQKNLLQAFVSQAGIAIENALLYEQMQDSVAKLRRLTDYTDNVLQSIEAAIITTDMRGQVARCNRAAEELLQSKARQLRAESLDQAFARLHLPQEEHDNLLRVVHRVQETGERIHRLKLTLHSQGRPTMTLYLMVSRLPERASERSDKAERAGLVIIFEDITQEMHLEAELEKMRRLADIGQLAAKMAHEVRNALSPIKGAAQLMREETGNVKWTDIIIEEVDGLSHLTDEMLNFARPTPPALSVLEVNPLLQSALQSLAPFLAENKTRLHWELSDCLPAIMADGAQLKQVIRNLVMNAAQAMPDGGLLSIQSDWNVEKRMVVMRFVDMGVGIAQDERERIFRPFVTTRPKGTGLGLPIVQKNVDNHGGYVEVESEPGQGTCFSVWLPLMPMEGGTSLQEPPLIYGRAKGIYPDN